MKTHHCINFLDQTHTLRMSPKWEDVRAVLATRGVDAQKTVLFGRDHAGGDDMALWLALADGSIVDCVLRKEAKSRRYASIVMWRTVDPGSDEELLQAKRTACDEAAAQAFETALKSFNDFCELIPP